MEAIDRWKERRPEWFAETIIDVGPENIGWSDLVHGLLCRIEQVLEKRSQARFQILQIKEKLGSIRVRYHVEEKGGVVRRVIAALVNEAVMNSERTCAVCGDAGTLSDKPGYLAVRCVRHSESLMRNRSAFG